jgi:type IV fimbrial biogenesis protein FimT
MITVSILGLLLTVGIPGFRNIVMNNQLVTQANEFAYAVSLARSAAIKRQRNASICVSTTYNASPPTCTGGTNWASGWVVWVDQDNDAVLDDGEAIRVNEPFGGSTVFTSGAKSSFQYNPMGLVDGPDTLTACDSRSGETGRQINVSPAGRVNTSSVTCS